MSEQFARPGHDLCRSRASFVQKLCRPVLAVPCAHEDQVKY